MTLFKGSPHPFEGLGNILLESLIQDIGFAKFAFNINMNTTGTSKEQKVRFIEPLKG
jgi:hypothetical protein